MTWPIARVLCALSALMVCANMWACGVSDAATTRPIGEPVCASCEPVTGGETTDFGEITACEAANERVVIDADEAEARGFDIARATMLVERTFDAPLHWATRDEPSGEAPSGYERETRVEGTTRITSFTHVLPGDDHCDETTCEIEGNEPFARASCPHRLELGVEIMLKTLDGALDVVAEGDVAVWAHGFEDDIGEGTADELHAHASADLSEVAGSLRLHPDAMHAHVGVLLLQLDFLEDETSGHLWPTLIYPDDTTELSRADVWLYADRYQPLEGTFPDAELGRSMASGSP
jgi:hypothetical protein